MGGGGWADRHICTEAVPCTRGEGSRLPFKCNSLSSVTSPLQPGPCYPPLSASHHLKEIKAELGEGGAFRPQGKLNALGIQVESKLPCPCYPRMSQQGLLSVTAEPEVV